MHYSRWKRHGDVHAHPKAELSASCERPGCAAPVRAKDLCKAHYADEFHKTRRSQPCSVPGCHRPHTNRGWCSAHYQRWLHHGSVRAGGPARRDRGTGYPQNWYAENRRRKLGWPDAETLQYIAVLRRDPCAYCGAPWEHTDHIHPVAAGGAGDWTNLTAACASCNHRKSTSDLLTFMLRRVTA